MLVCREEYWNLMHQSLTREILPGWNKRETKVMEHTMEAWIGFLLKNRRHQSDTSKNQNLESTRNFYQMCLLKIRLGIQWTRFLSKKKTSCNSSLLPKFSQWEEFQILLEAMLKIVNRWICMKIIRAKFSQRLTQLISFLVDKQNVRNHLTQILAIRKD